MTPYVSDVEFQAYVDGYVINSCNYDNADPVKRSKAVNVATRAIDRLNFNGSVTDPTQENQFPRGGDVVVPDAIKNATCELALAYLNDQDLQSQFDSQNIRLEAFMGVKTSYSGDFYAVNVVNGIISWDAWLLLQPYLRPITVEIVKG